MAIRKIQGWIAECDKCKKRYDYGDIDYIVFATKKNLIEDLTDTNNMEDWKITKDITLCEECR